ncbi:MAG TPA: hypothetical protein VFI24_03740 [Pyrinomonadaceae bacterium]|nr:hypothetical protein [Pyrinomonadaceae bacterium]
MRSETKPLSGVKINLEGLKLTSIWTDANGYYAFTDLPAGGSYTITPMGPMNFKPSRRTFDDLRNDQSADFFVPNEATPTPTPTPTMTQSPTPTPTPTPKPECSEADQVNALRGLKSLEPSWRRKIQGEQAQIIRENVPNNIQNAEARLEGIDFQYSFTKPCAVAVLTIRYTWLVSWPANPLSQGKNKNVPKERKYLCGGRLGMWSCPLELR